MEEDFISAELEAVPAGKARDIGFDRSFIAAYGHDDRVCAYAELAGIFDAEEPEAHRRVHAARTRRRSAPRAFPVCSPQAFDKFMADLCEAQGVAAAGLLWQTPSACRADVTAAYDPNFADVYDKRNAAFVNYGVGLCKYTGARRQVRCLRRLCRGGGPMCAGCWTRTACSGRWPSWARRTPAAAAPWPSSWPSATSTPSTRAFPCSPCTRPYETVAKLDCYMTYKTMRVIFEQN